MEVKTVSGAPTRTSLRGHGHARTSSLALPAHVGGTIKQRPAGADAAAPSASVSAPALFNQHARTASLPVAQPDVDAPRKTHSLLPAPCSALSKSRITARLAAHAYRAVFLLALLAFLRALFGFGSGPTLPSASSLSSASPFVAEAGRRLPLHHRALRTFREVHARSEHHPLPVDPDGHVSIALDYGDGFVPARSERVRWVWAASAAGAGGKEGEGEGDGTAREVEGVPEPTTADQGKGAAVPSEAPAQDFDVPIPEGAVVHPLRVYLPDERKMGTEGAYERARRHGRGRDVG